jgi:hypothetical protein
MKKVESKNSWPITKKLSSDSKSKADEIESRPTNNINETNEEIKVWKKEQLQEMVRLKTAILVDADWHSGSSWKQYYCVQINAGSKGEVCKYFAVCKNCLMWLSVPLGTSTTLSRHTATHESEKCAKLAKPIDVKQNKITGFVKPSVPQTVRSKVMKDTLYMIAHDGQPFSVVEDVGFRKLAQTLITVGANYGNMDIESVLYDRTSLSKTHLTNEHESLVESVRKKINLFARYVAITTDHWTDDTVKNSYQAFTIHYLTEEFKLINTCLGVYDFPEGHTAVAIKAKTSEVLRKFLSPMLLASVAYVTDNAANIKAAYKNDMRFSCAGHNLNLVVNAGLKSESSGFVTEMINTAKSVVGYFKHSGHNKDFAMV